MASKWKQSSCISQLKSKARNGEAGSEEVMLKVETGPKLGFLHQLAKLWKQTEAGEPLWLPELRAAAAVIETSAETGEGMEELKALIENMVS